MGFDDFVKTFTRYFVPGVTFVVVGLFLPAILLGFVEISALKDYLTATNILVASILFGYMVDAIRGYRWTLHLFAYTRYKKALASELCNLVGTTSWNPDDFLADLWLKKGETYDRIFVERAEWVMIMETAFALLISGITLLGCGCIRCPTLVGKPCIAILGIGFVIVSCLASSNGIARMKSHDRKLIAAIRRYQEQETKGDKVNGVI